MRFRTVSFGVLAVFLIGAGSPLLPGAQLYRTHDQACDCDPTRSETMQARQCSLCREAEAQAPGILFFFLKDNNPRKPNRWLILPRTHSEGMHHLQMGAEQSESFWKAAVEKASSLWGSGWGLAVNGERTRTQCHAHVHVGKLVEGVEDEAWLYNLGATPSPGQAALVVRDVSQLRIPAAGEGFWIHPAGGELHVHVEDPSAACEFVLMR